MKARADIDILNGKILPSLWHFSLPIILAGLLQVAYNAADLMVVGNFAHDGGIAVASVGATGSISHLLINCVIGFAAGLKIVLARYLGAGDAENVKKTVHTAIVFSLLAGLAISAVGFFLAEPMLRLTNCPPEALDGAVLYLRIYCLGAPAMALMNFGGAVLQTKGDTKNPLYYMIFSGILNVILNIFFVMVLDMAAGGVALATALSQLVAGVLTLRRLMLNTDMCHVSLGDLRLSPTHLKRIVRYGLPAAISSGAFSFSNLQIQSAINSYGAACTAGSAASGSIEGFIGTASSAMTSATVSFVGQNLGAGNRERVKKIIFSCLFLGIAMGLSAGLTMLLLSDSLLQLYIPGEAEAIAYAKMRLQLLLTTYFLPICYNVFAGTLQAFGYAKLQMVVSLTGVVGFRLMWMGLVYPRFTSAFCLFFCYPCSWASIAIGGGICTLIVWRKYTRQGIQAL